MEIEPTELYSVARVKQLERLAIDKHGITEDTLMERAGTAAFLALKSSWPDAKRIVVFCGAGNNAGDGYVLARLAKETTLDVQVICLKNPNELAGAALMAATKCKAAGLEPTFFDSEQTFEADVIVDALLGTGLAREVEGPYREAIEVINAHESVVVAMDVPSGLSADKGTVCGVAVEANLTMTFIVPKQGLYTGEGLECCGEVICDDLDIPVSALDDVDETVFRLTLADLPYYLPPRPRASHKGDYGHLLVIGGNYGMSGAVRMSAEAAARVGAGLVSIATRPINVDIVSLTRPELMCHGVRTQADLKHLLDAATTIVMGPGLGQDAWAEDIFAMAIEADCPKVIDADGLNLLAKNPSVSDQWILTPHPGEAARLLTRSVQEIQHDRFSALMRLQEQYGGTCVLKGAGSLVLGPEEMMGLCDKGNPGMASGGMGDVLSGILGGLMAQGLSGETAAQLGVCLHAQAGDLAVAMGERGTLASDLMPFLRQLVN